MPKLNINRNTNLPFDPPPATKKQIAYIEILFNDCGFGTREKRLDYLKLRGMAVKYLDELTIREASSVIEDLISRKAKPVQEREKEDYRVREDYDDSWDDDVPF